MAILHLFRGRMNGTKVSYNTCTYDFASATEGTDYVLYQNSAVAGGQKCPWEFSYPVDPTKTVKTMRVDIPLAGMNYFNGLKDPASAPLRIDPWGSANGGSNISMISYSETTPPSDWNVHWRDKYYTRTQETYVGDLGPEVYNFYHPIREGANTFDPNTTYYYVDETQSKPMQYAWWTKTGNFFGGGTGWGPATNMGYLQAAQEASGPNQFSQPPNWGEPNPLWWTAGGVSGTQIGYYQAVRGPSARINSDNYNIHDAPEFSPILLDFISYEFDGDVYIGFVVIKYGIDGVPSEAQISTISEEFWKDENGSSYTGPISLPGGGDGEYNDQDDQKGKKGKITAYNFGAVAPGASGFKVCKGKYGAIQNIMDKFIYYLNNIGTPLPTGRFVAAMYNDPLKTMDLFRSSILSVYKVPIEPDASQQALAQWQVCGETFEIDEGYALHYNLPRYSYLDCGAVSIARWHDSFLDYEPYTKVYIFLPFIGTYELPVSDLMYGTLYLEYYQDNLNGDLLARLTCYNGAYPNAHVQDVGLSPYWHLIGEFTGNGLMQIPATVSVGTMGIYGLGQAISGGVRTALSSGDTFSAGGSEGNVSDKAPQFGESPVPSMSGGVGNVAGIANVGMKAIKGGLETAKRLIQTHPSATAILSNYVGNTGYMGTLTPYIKIVRTLYDEPATQGHDKGYPSNVSIKLANLPDNSFNICSGSISLDDSTFPLSATKEEKDKIISILTAGFYR